jgi:hypothetical protein
MSNLKSSADVIKKAYEHINNYLISNNIQDFIKYSISINNDNIQYNNWDYNISKLDINISDIINQHANKVGNIIEESYSNSLPEQYYFILIFNPSSKMEEVTFPLKIQTKYIKTEQLHFQLTCSALPLENIKVNILSVVIYIGGIELIISKSKSTNVFKGFLTISIIQENIKHIQAQKDVFNKETKLSTSNTYYTFRKSQIS